MKKQTISLLLSGLILTGCASTTMIQSNPSGAKVYLNGEAVGMTPYTHKDRKIVGMRTNVKLVKDGYEPFEAHFNRAEKLDVGALVGGIFIDFPLLWIMKYKPTHTYELKPSMGNQQQASNTQQQPNQGGKSKEDRLLELKKLLDEKALTQNEYDKEKKKILAED